MKRVLAVAAALVLAGGVAALGAAGAAAAGRSVTLHLVEKDVGFNFVDNPPRQGFQSPPLIGDQFAFTSDLLTRSGEHAGLLEASCMITRGGVHGKATCTGSFLLKGGQVALSAGIDFTEENQTNHIAIVGGTGAYEGVTGSIVSKPRGPNSAFSDDTVHLIYP